MSSSSGAGAATPSGGLSLTENTENYILVDIGANLTSKKYSRDLDSVVQRAKNAGTSDSLPARPSTSPRPRARRTRAGCATDW